MTLEEFKLELNDTGRIYNKQVWYSSLLATPEDVFWEV